jgi:hypothetical protein
VIDEAPEFQPTGNAASCAFSNETLNLGPTQRLVGRPPMGFQTTIELGLDLGGEFQLVSAQSEGGVLGRFRLAHA